MSNRDPRFDENHDEITDVRLVDYHHDEMTPRDRLAFERQMDESEALRQQSDEISQVLSLFSCLADHAPGFRPEGAVGADNAGNAATDATWDGIRNGCWVMDRLPAYHVGTMGLAGELALDVELTGVDRDRIERAVAGSPFLAVESAEIAAALAAWRGAVDVWVAPEKFAPEPDKWDELAKRLAIHDQLVEYHRGELDPAQCAQVRCAVERSDALGEASDEIARVVKGVARLGEMDPPASTWDAIARRLTESEPHAPRREPRPDALASTSMSSTPMLTAARPRSIRAWRARLLVASVLALSAWGVGTAWRASRDASRHSSDARLVAGALSIETPNGKTSPVYAGQPARHLEPGDRLVAGDDRARVVLGQGSGELTLVLEAATDVELVAPGQLLLRCGRIYLASAGGSPSWTVLVSDLELRLVGTEVDVELARDRTCIQVLDGRVAVSVRERATSESPHVTVELPAGSGLDVPHSPSPIARSLATASPFAIEAEHLRTGWQVEPLMGRLRVVEERDARGVRKVALLTLTNTTADRVQLVAAGSTRRCWLVVDVHRGDAAGRGAQIPLVLDGASAQRDALEGGASHTFRVDVTDQFRRPGSYDVRARYLVGRAARDVGSPAHSVTTPAFTLVVE